MKPQDQRGKHELPSYRIDLWHNGNIAETLAYISSYAIAVETFWKYTAHYPNENITLRQGARVVLERG